MAHEERLESCWTICPDVGVAVCNRVKAQDTPTESTPLSHIKIREKSILAECVLCRDERKEGETKQEDRRRAAGKILF